MADNKPYIFLSYAHFDSERVLPVILDLMEMGYNVWFDAGIEAGTEWPEYIAEQLYGCTVFLSFVSRFYLDSQNCSRELYFAHKLNKQKAVVCLDYLTLPPKIEEMLEAAPTCPHSHHDTQKEILEKICAMDVIAQCLDGAESAASTQKETSAEDDFFYAKDCMDTGRREEGAELFLKAAQKGHIEAMYMLSECYAWGTGVLTDHTESAKWCLRAAEGGHGLAMKELGNKYRNGRGMPQDITEAVKWYRRSAEAGDKEGQFMLGSCYQDGEGVPRDLNEAIKWYRKAAEQGDSMAQNALEVCLDQQVSKEQTNTRSGSWLSRLFGR